MFQHTRKSGEERKLVQIFVLWGFSAAHKIFPFKTEQFAQKEKLMKVFLSFIRRDLKFFFPTFCLIFLPCWNGKMWFKYLFVLNAVLDKVYDKFHIQVFS